MTLRPRAVGDQFERLHGAHGERFEPAHGFLCRSVPPAAHRHLDCGNLAHGAAGAHCVECGYDQRFGA